MMFNIVGKRPWFFSISGVLILVSAIVLVVFGLKAGIDFASGSILTVSFEESVVQPELEEELARRASEVPPKGPDHSPETMA